MHIFMDFVSLISFVCLSFQLSVISLSFRLISLSSTDDSNAGCWKYVWHISLCDLLLSHHRLSLHVPLCVNLLSLLSLWSFLSTSDMSHNRLPVYLSRFLYFMSLSPDFLTSGLSPSSLDILWTSSWIPFLDISYTLLPQISHNVYSRSGDFPTSVTRMVEEPSLSPTCSVSSLQEFQPSSWKRR